MILSTRGFAKLFAYCLIAMLAAPEAAFPRSPDAGEVDPAEPQAPASGSAGGVDTHRSAWPLRGFKSIRILPLEGDGAINSLSTNSAVIPVVAVHGDDEMPVEGAMVAFELPASGPGGYFPDNQRILKTLTNSRGQAVAHGFRANSQTGRFPIRVTASLQDRTATYLMTQTNSRKAVAEMTSRGSSRKWLWIAVAGVTAGAAGAAISWRVNSPTRISASVAGPVVLGAP
jgi:hypothetical protein